MAEATYFTMAALRNPAPVALEATVHGQPFKPGWQTLAEQQEYGTGEGAGPAEQDSYPQQLITIHGPL